jgi:hypothetical protein
MKLTIRADNSVHGLFPGTGISEVVDGWTVRYDKFLATAGDFRAFRASGGLGLRHEDIYVIDILSQFPTSRVLLRFDGVPEGSFVGFDLAMPTATNAVKWNSTVDDMALMQKGGYSLYIEGTMTSPKGQSCVPGDPMDCVPAPTIKFLWGIQAETYFQGCAGFNVESAQTTSVPWTITADHWFFTGFSANADMTQRRAQWVADADLDRNGETTLYELKTIKAAALFTPELGYKLTGAPIPVETAYDFLVAQVHTMGLDRANGCTSATPAG